MLNLEKIDTTKSRILSKKMVKDCEKWYSLAVKSISMLLHEITSKYNDDGCCNICFHSFRTENRIKLHDDICKNHDYCHLKMPKACNKILKFNQKHKSMMIPLLSRQTQNGYQKTCQKMITLQKSCSYQRQTKIQRVVTHY